MEIFFNRKEPFRLDKFLVEAKISELYSRTFIDKLILDKAVKVNGTSVKKSHLLKSGDKITVEIPEIQVSEIKPEKIDLDIRFEDEFIAIINKPAGITVHPAPGNETGTIVNAILYHFNEDLAYGTDPTRPGIVHRLDKDTSGLLLIAKNDRAQSLLAQMFQQREIDKHYTAIVTGIPPEEEGSIKTLINRSKSDRKKMAVSKEGKEAITHYKITRFFDVFSMIDVTLETGRTHQIRVHFSHLNCPILGDPTYSSLKRTLNMIPYNYRKKVKYLLANHLKRQALHASRLKFIHPITQKLISVEAELPEDMQYCLNWLEKYFQ